MRPPLCAVLPFLALAAGLLPLSSAAAPGYRAEVLVRNGDRVGSFAIKNSNNLFDVAAMDDQGRIFFNSWGSPSGQLLLQFDRGVLVPIVLPGQASPFGKWPQDTSFWLPSPMNKDGNLVFHAEARSVGSLGTFLWNAAARQVTPIATPGQVIGPDLTVTAGQGCSAGINNRGEIVFVVPVKNAAGVALRRGIFFRDTDGHVQVIALPGQELPGGEIAGDLVWNSLNDAGMATFTNLPPGSQYYSTYLWEKGAITPIARKGQSVPQAGRISWASYAQLNNHDRTVLVNMAVQAGGPRGLYRWSNGQFRRVAVRYQEMPGGGELDEIVGPVSFASEAGQYAFTATVIDDDTTFRGAYRVDTSGEVSLILKEGDRMDGGTITHLAVIDDANRLYGIALNAGGQVALPVRINDEAPVLLLLSPEDGRQPLPRASLQHP